MCEALVKAGREVVVVDHDEERLLRAEAAGLRTLSGEATDEAVLRRAGIERASTLISVLDDDAQNISVVLSARELGPGVRIVARASNARAAHKLRYAGADEAIDPHHLSGRRIAGLLLSPHLTAFLDAENEDHFRLEERPLPQAWAGRTVEQVMHELDAVVVAVWRGDTPVLPRPSEALQAGDLLVLSLPPDARRG